MGGIRKQFFRAKTISQLIKGIEGIDDGSFVFCDENDRFYIKMHSNLIGITPKKQNVKGLKCNSCGASLEPNFLHGSIVKCEYCGSVYDIDTWDQDPV